MNSAQGGMVTADNRNLDQPQRSLPRVLERLAIMGRMPANRSSYGGRGLSHHQRRSGSEGSHALLRLAHRAVPGRIAAMWAVVTSSPLKYPHNDDHSINARINLVNLGDAQILTIPGEALPNIGFYLKRKMHGKHNLLFGLTNEAFGYILTKVDFHSFPRYDYVSRPRSAR